MVLPNSWIPCDEVDVQETAWIWRLLQSLGPHFAEAERPDQGRLAIGLADAGTPRG